MHRQIAVAGVVVLVLLSGCSALVGSDDTATPGATPTPTEYVTPTATITAADTPTATAASTPTATDTATDSPTPQEQQDTPTPAPDLEPVSSMDAPPGVERRALTNDTALVESHREQLAGTTYRTDLTAYNTSRENVTLSVRNGTESILTTFDNPSEAQRNDYFYGPNRSGVRNRTSGEIRYGHGPTGVAFQAGFVAAAFRGIGPQYATSAEWYATGVRTTDSGEKRLVFAAGPLNQTQALNRSLVSEGETFQHIDGRMEVGPDGVIYAIDLFVTLETTEGNVETTGIEYRLRDRGDVQVSDPSWLGEPPQLEASVTANDTLLVVDHTGSETIDAGTNISVGGAFVGGSNVTLDQHLEAGDTLYVYQTGDSFDPTVHASVNERPTVPDEAVPFSGSVIVSGTQGSYTFEAGVEIEENESESA